jgi:hypothetical protein
MRCRLRLRLAIQHRIECRIVVHLELAIQLETPPPGERIGPEGVEAGCEIVTLFIQHGKAAKVAVAMFGRRAVRFFIGVENFQGEDGKPVDDQAGGLGMERSGRILVYGLPGEVIEQGEVDLLGEVVAQLVEPVDGVLHFGDGVVGGERVAGLVLAMPEVEVGLMLVEHEPVEAGAGAGCGRGRDDRCRLVAVERGLVVEAEDARGVKHEGWSIRG